MIKLKFPNYEFRLKKDGQKRFIFAQEKIIMSNYQNSEMAQWRSHYIQAVYTEPKSNTECNM